MYYDVIVQNRHGHQCVLTVFGVDKAQAEIRARATARRQTRDRSWQVVAAVPSDLNPRQLPGRRIR